MTLDLHEDEEFEDEDEELCECPRCHGEDIGLFTFACSSCNVECCENCSSGGLCDDCEANERGIVTVRFK